MLSRATDYIRPGGGAECSLSVLYCEAYLVIVGNGDRELVLLTVAMGIWLLG